jgi:hypothetical protein
MTLVAGISSGWAAILGALVGGSITGVVTLLAEGERQKFQQRLADKAAAKAESQERAVARGAARALRSQLLRVAANMAVSGRQGKWWPLDRQVEIEFPFEDRKLVASLLPPRDWTMVEFSEANYLNLLGRRQTRNREEQRAGLPVLEPDDRRLMAPVYRSVQRGIHALPRSPK